MKARELAAAILALPPEEQEREFATFDGDGWYDPDDDWAGVQIKDGLITLATSFELLTPQEREAYYERLRQESYARKNAAWIQCDAEQEVDF